MNWRAVIFSLASLGLLSTIAPQGAGAQGRPRGNPGGFHFAPSAGARGRFGGPGYGGPGFSAQAFGGQGFSGRSFGGRGTQGFGPPAFGGGSYGGGVGGYGRGAYGSAPYGQGLVGQEPYGRIPESAPRPYAPPPYPPYEGYARSLANGDWRQQQYEVRQAVRDGRHIPLGRAIDAVRQRTPGRELDAGLEPGPSGRTVYRLRWAASNGRRIDYLVDAATGAIVGEQGGR